MPKAKKTSVIPTSTFLSKIRGFRQKPNRKLVLALIILGVAILVYLNKSLLFAATVNGQLITASEVSQILNRSYKDKVLSQIIDQKILEQEAAKKGIVITNQQTQSKINEIANSYGGKASFDMLLSQQGLTEDQFASQIIKPQLIAESLYKDQINPTGDEIDKFIKDNANLPEATEPAKFKRLAEEQLKQQKLQTVFNQKFQELKKNAKVQIF